MSALLFSATGSVLATRWSTSVPLLASTCWQLLAAGVVLLPIALVAEGPPPAYLPETVAGYTYVAVVAGALSFSCWFAGVRHLRAGPVGLVGLFNPLAGIALGVAVAGESLTG